MLEMVGSFAPPFDASVVSPLGNSAIFSSHSSSREQQLGCPGYQQICWRQKNARLFSSNIATEISFRRGVLSLETGLRLLVRKPSLPEKHTEWCRRKQNMRISHQIESRKRHYYENFFRR